MKKTILQMIIIAVFVLIVGNTNCYAEGATLSLSSNTVKPGETVELSIALSTESIGYDLNISSTNSSAIASSELVNNLDKGNTSRIYMVQIAGESDRKVYTSGTKLATIKYKIAENAKEGDKIVITVAGDVIGKNSSEKNSMNESVTLTVAEKTEVPALTTTPTPTPTQTQTVTPTLTTVPTQTKNDTTPTAKSNGNLPKAGDRGAIILLVTVGIMGMGLVALRQYNKMKIK